MQRQESIAPMIVAKSFALAAFLTGRGHEPDQAVRIDASTGKPAFTFPTAPESEAREYRRIIDFLNALEHVARHTPTGGR